MGRPISTLRGTGRVWLSLGLVYNLSSACTPSTTVEMPTANVKSTKNGADLKKEEPETLGGEDTMESTQGPGTEPTIDETADPAPTMETTPDTEEPVVTDPVPDMKTDPKPEPMEDLVVANGKYVIRSVHSQRCLDIPNASQTTGTGLEIYDCSNEPSAAQTFELKHVGNKMYQITLVASGKSLEVRGQILEATKLIQQAPYVGGKYQQFEFLPQSDGTYIIRCNGANLVLDVREAKVDNKTPIQIWTPNNFVNEQWTLTPIL